MLGIPPEVIATEQHGACIPQQCAERSFGVPWRGDELKAFGNRNHITACDQLFCLRGRVSISRMNPAVTSKRPGPALMVCDIVAVGQHDEAQTTKGLDPSGQRRTPSRNIHHHVA